MKYIDLSCEKFTYEMHTKKAVPGGGGAAALAGAIGAALAGMVGNLTLGKKKFEEYEEDIQKILKKAESLQLELLKMIDSDAENFLPLSKAYCLPKDTIEEKRIKKETLEKCLKQACSVPVDIVHKAYEGIILHEELVTKCSTLAISDVGVGVQCLRAAIISGWINVLINIKSIEDSKYVEKIENRTKPLVAKGIKIADKVYAKVEKILMR